METNLCRSFITCLEWMRICVGFLLIAWSGNEYLHDLHCLLGVETNLCRIFIDCLEWKCISAWSSLLAWVWKRICVGSLLIVWSGNESVHEFYCLFGVDANLCRIFIDCLEWKWISTGSSLLPYSENESVKDLHCLFGVDRSCAWYLLLVWSGNGSMVDCIACLEWKRICAGFVLLAWSVNEYVQVIYCLCMSVSALWIQLFCLIPAYYVLVTSYALDFQRHMLWSSTLCSMNWSERLLFPLLIFMVLFTITVYNYLSKLSGRNIV